MTVGIDDITFTCKNADIREVLNNSTENLDRLLLTCPLKNNKKHTSVDIKIQTLNIGNYTCIPGWHKDSISDDDPWHHIYIVGENRTEFKKFGRVYKIPENTWYTYQLQIHRGPRCIVDETRIFIRVTESDTVRPNSTLTPI